MTDNDIVNVRLSGTDVGKLADAIAGLDGWTVLDRREPLGRSADREYIHLTVRYGYPPVTAITAWLAANGWQATSTGIAGSLWVKVSDVGRVGVPLVDSDPKFTRESLVRIAAAEGLDLGELVALIDAGRSGG